MSKKQKAWIAAGGSVVVIIALVLVVASVRAQNNNTTAYQTTTVQLGTLTSTVEGTGTVTSTQSANLAWQTSGQVDQVSGLIGDQVKAGDALANLLQSSLPQSILQAQSNLVTAQENLSELISPEAIANAKLAVAVDQSNVVNAQIGVNNNLYWKNDALIKDYYANLVIAKDKLDNAQAAYDDAHVGDYINNTGEAQLYKALYSAQQAYNHAQYLYSVYSQKPPQSQIDEAQAKLDLANATLTSDQYYLTALTGGDVPPDATGAALQKFEEAKLAVQIALATLDAIKITAPFDGIITQANVFPGSVVSAGTQAFRIDNLFSLVVMVNVTEIDINGIQVGQPATITFDAIPNKTYYGNVIMSDIAGTVSTNSVNFSVTVKVTDADSKVKPGMAANVTVVTNKVANALLVPSTSIFTDTTGQQYVYLIQNGAPTTVPVTVGDVSDSTTQITSNTLKEGDTIVLSFASTSTTNEGGFGLGGLGGFGGGVRVQPPASTP